MNRKITLTIYLCYISFIFSINVSEDYFLSRRASGREEIFIRDVNEERYALAVACKSLAA